jgi:glutamate-5-semialdehyde dehydrogenase
MTTNTKDLRQQVMAARAASRELARTSTAVKDQALANIAKELTAREKELVEANRLDYEEGKGSGLSETLLDRLLLTPDRLRDLSRDVLKIADLPDPVGETFDMRTMPNGLQIGKRRVPLGVIGTVYESRPNVTIDISALCLKSGNAVVLRGGKEAIRSNLALARLVQEAIARAGGSANAVQFVESTDRALVEEMLHMRGLIDLLIPRGGDEFIRYVAETATIPVVTGGVGVCHTYVDCTADMDNAVAIAYNAKVQRPSVCNALDTLLVHSEIATRYLPQIGRAWGEAGVEMHCDERAYEILQEVTGARVVRAKDSDWGKEFLSLVASVRVVDDIQEAMSHIETHGSGHSEAIITEDYSLANTFLEQVDAAAVFVNASTRFTDGGQFGLGAEVGISTQKMHARGPMGLKELTSYKWIILGKGHIRP